MAKVKFGDEEHELPALISGAFDGLRDQFRLRQAIVSNGTRPQPPILFGLVKRSPVPLAPEERFAELDLLVSDYQKIIEELKSSQARYESFFRSLAKGVRRVVRKKSEEVRQIEQERIALAASSRGDRVLEDQLARQHEDLVSAVRLMMRCTVLIIKKIDFFRNSLETLAKDEEAQRAVLAELLGRLNLHRRAYNLSKRVDDFRRDVAEMASVALGFDEALRQGLGPLETLVDSVSVVDAKLHRAVYEIESMTRSLVTEQGGSIGVLELEERDKVFIDLMMRSAVKREQFAEALRARRECESDDAPGGYSLDAGAGTPSVLDALDRLEVFVEDQLKEEEEQEEEEEKEEEERASWGGQAPQVLAPLGFTRASSSVVDNSGGTWIHCVECGHIFPFSVGEQQWYAGRGFQTPKRCKQCRSSGRRNSW